MAASFRKRPQESARQIAEALSMDERLVLLREIGRHGVPESAKASIGGIDDKYLKQLFDSADTNAPKGLLDKEELRAALGIDRALNGTKDTGATCTPPAAALALMALSAGIPFVGFGFMDNAIMLVAGEEIDVVFGEAWGLSKLAAAGLGNIVADVVGVGFAEQIEDWVRKIKYIRPPRLSRVQRDMVSSKVARIGGAMLGVSIGGLMGLVPLLWLDG